MAGFNWVYKNNQLIRWCQNSLPAGLFVSLLSCFNPFLRVAKERFFTTKPLWINLYEICFPQKYIILPMQSGGIRSAVLLLLFSSKSRPEPADCVFSFREMLRSCPSADGLTLSRPVLLQGIRTQNNKLTGIMKGEFNPVPKTFF
jgi:hypothetical protein